MMDVGPINSPASAAGRPWRSRKGRRAIARRRESAIHQRGVQYDAKADQAAGIGQTDGEEHTTEDRYGDGRQPWQLPAAGEPATDADNQDEEKPPAPRDPSGPSGRLIDLSG